MPSHSSDSPKNLASLAVTQAVARRCLRSRTGCTTCKVRHVKCDEAKPSCRRCTSTGRKCDGYQAATVSRRGIVEALQRGDPLDNIQYGSNTFTNDHDRRSFQFFHENTARSDVTNPLDQASGFWDQIVLQLVHTEPAIKHGVLSLSVLHQSFSAGHEHAEPKGHAKKLAMVSNYAMAVSSITALISTIQTTSTVEKILSACIIFATIESLLPNPVGARMHLENGLRIRRQEQVRLGQISGRQWKRQSIITQALERLNCGIMTFSLVSAPFLSTRQDTPSASAVLGSFSSFKDAEKSLFRLIRDMSTFGERQLMKANVFELAVEGASTTTLFRQQAMDWETAFQSLLEDIDVDSIKSKVLLLRLYHKTIYIISVASEAPTEMGWDLLDKEFTQVLDTVDLLASLPRDTTYDTTFSLELGTIVPLFLVACRCRNPEIRRRAIKVLCAQRRKEMVWESLPAAVLADWIMSLEENGAYPKTPDGRPNNLDRARIIGIEIKLSTSKLHAQAWFPSNIQPGTFRKVEAMLDTCMGLGERDACVCSRPL